MIFLKAGRAVALALALFFATLQSLWAHALPGTVLTLSQDDGTIVLSIAVNVEDLVIAEPELAPLYDLSLGHVGEPEISETVARYFSTHMSLKGASSPVMLELGDIELITDQNEHVGEFRAIFVTFTGQIQEPVFPLVLRYDAVMHEVRNHRAAVYWQPVRRSPEKLSEFGYHRVDGETQAIELLLPAE